NGYYPNSRLVLTLNSGYRRVVLILMSLPSRINFLAKGLLCFFLSALAAGAAPALIPLPQIVQTNPGSFTLCPPQVIPGAPAPAATLILADQAERETAEYLAMALFKSTGYRLQIASNSGSAAVPQAIL